MARLLMTTRRFALLLATILAAVAFLSISLGALISPAPTPAQVRQAVTLRVRSEVVDGVRYVDRETIRGGRVVAHSESP